MPIDPLPDHDRSFFDVLEQRAALHPERTAYIAVGADGTETARLAYGELHRRVQAYADALSARNVGGSRALMLFEPGLAFIVTFLGCLRAGVVAIPANIAKPGRTSWDRLVAIVRDSGASSILTEQTSTTKLAGWFSTNPELATLDILCLENASGDPTIPRVRPHEDTPAFLQYTSGSTGNPKGTVISFGNLAANARITGPATGIDHDARVVTWLPPYHDLGLIGNILQTLWAGAECVLMPPVSFVQNPSRWLETIDRYRATVSMAPNFAYELCVRRIPEARRGDFDLSSWKVAFNAAEPIRASAIHRFRDAFRESGFRAASMQTAYGLAEATLVVSAADPDAEPVMLSVDSIALDEGRIEVSDHPERRREIVGSGRVRAPQHVRIVNPETGTPCTRDEIGEIWVSGPCVAHGYWGRDEETRRTFQARTTDDDGPYLRTGDLGMVRDGELYVTGRIKEVIIVRGRKIYPQDIEATVQRAHDALRPAGGAAFAVETGDGEALVVVQEVERSMLATVDRQDLVSLISAAVLREHDLAISEVVLVKPEVVPKTSSGKIQRVLCRELHRRGELDRIVQGRSPRLTSSSAGISGGTAIEEARAPAHTAARSPVEHTIDDGAPANTSTPTNDGAIVSLIIDWLSANGLKPPTSAQQTFAELGCDSVRAVELALHLETVLAVPVDSTAVYEHSTISALAASLHHGLDGGRAARLPAKGVTVDDDIEIPGW